MWAISASVEEQPSGICIDDTNNQWLASHAEKANAGNFSLFSLMFMINEDNLY